MRAVTVFQAQAAMNEWLQTPGLTVFEAGLVRALRDEAKKGTDAMIRMARDLYSLKPSIAQSAVAKARAAGIGKEWPFAR